MYCDEQKRFRNSLGRSRHLFSCRGKFVCVIVRFISLSQALGRCICEKLVDQSLRFLYNSTTSFCKVFAFQNDRFQRRTFYRVTAVVHCTISRLNYLCRFSKGNKQLVTKTAFRSVVECFITDDDLLVRLVLKERSFLFRFL